MERESSARIASSVASRSSGAAAPSAGAARSSAASRAGGKRRMRGSGACWGDSFSSWQSLVIAGEERPGHVGENEPPGTLRGR